MKIRNDENSTVNLYGNLIFVCSRCIFLGCDESSESWIEIYSHIEVNIVVFSKIIKMQDFLQ